VWCKSIFLMTVDVIAAVNWSASAARENVTFMLPNPLPAADHIRVVTTSEGDFFIAEKRKLPCVEYIARGIQCVTAELPFQTLSVMLCSLQRIYILSTVAHLKYIFMAALHSRCGQSILSLWLLSFFPCLFSAVYHTSTHDVVLVRI